MPPQIAPTKHDWPALLDAARGGDSQAIGEACRRVHDYLLLTAQRGLARDLRSKMGASDIVQQSLLEAQHDFGCFTGVSEGELRAWLVRILQNNLIDSARQFHDTQQRDTSREVSLERQFDSEEIADHQETASGIIRRTETDEELLRAIVQLPERRRRVVELRQRDGLNYCDIGAVLGITEMAARKLWSRALVDLRRILSQPYVERSGKTQRPGQSR